MQQVAARSGRDVLGKVWRLFLSQAADAVAKLEAASAEGDAPALARQAHFLKSMSLSSGAARLAALCENIETDAKAGRAEAFARARNVRSLADATCTRMAERLAVRSISAAAS
jgi:two-component system sensor histidine kinase BarA